MNVIVIFWEETEGRGWGRCCSVLIPAKKRSAVKFANCKESKIVLRLCVTWKSQHSAFWGRYPRTPPHSTPSYINTAFSLQKCWVAASLGLQKGTVSGSRAAKGPCDICAPSLCLGRAPAVLEGRLPCTLPACSWVGGFPPCSWYNDVHLTCGTLLHLPTWDWGQAATELFSCNFDSLLCSIQIPACNITVCVRALGPACGP